MSSLKSIDEEELRKQLAQLNFELISHSPIDANRHMRVQVKKLQGVSVKHNLLYVPIMAVLSVVLDKNNTIQGFEEDPSVKNNIADAERFVKTLVDNKKLQGLTDSNDEATHQVELNEKGQQVIKRKRFF